MNHVHESHLPQAPETPGGSETRKQRALIEREHAILKAALALVAEQGFLNMSMAELARRSEYATGTLYKHFACKEDLLLALTARGNVTRAEMMARVARWDAPSRDRMMAIGYSDLLFVTHHPVHFRLEQMASAEDVWTRASDCRRTALINAGSPCADHVQAIVDDAVASGDLKLRDYASHEVTLGLWTMSMGTHTLVHAAGVLEHHDIATPYQLLGRNYALYLNALGWQPIVTPSNEAYRLDLRTRLHAEVFPDYTPPAAAPVGT